MVVEAYVLKKEGNLAIEPEPPDKPVLAKGNANMQRLDCIYDDEPLGDLVELKLPIKTGRKPVRQTPRRFATVIMAKIKAEVERLLKSKFIQTARRFISNLSGKTKAFSPLLRLKNEDFKWQEEHQEAFDKIKEYLIKPSVLAPPVRNRPMRLYITASESTIGMLPVEIQVQAVRTQRQYEIPSEDYWSMMVDELVDLDEEIMLALDSLQRQKEKVARAYNKKVKGKMFAVVGLVWRVILPMDRNGRVLGKWSPNWEGPFKVLQVGENYV
ncbi:uncharacterized protein LOC127094311 [Lathyrus oleraceus]|uniref:uncharacterized protein LOC127094311 n=1 Tax=Pisum sativum TaxID=3888 RepID=UPI0021CF9A63|nr:uncharacterized protein LOC127094311 [Pisum sativum]